MAVSLYCGTPGSGKSYEVVAFVILPALARGRRVVTNIAGFDEFAARDYLMQHDKVPPSSLGSVVLVDDDEVTKPGFFPVADREADTVVRGGDLVVIDEAWKFWGVDSPVGDEALDFFRKHRHMTDRETGVSCDLVVIAQEPAALHRKIRGVVELSFKARKLKSVGLNSAYTVHQFEGPNQRRKPFGTQTRRYNKAIFPLYSSYSGAKGASGREMVVDDRQNLLKRPSVWLTLVAVICLFVWGLTHALAFFSPEKVSTDKPPVIGKGSVGSASGSSAALEVSPIADRFGEPAGDRSAAPLRPIAVREVPPLSKDWRLAGFLRFGDRVKVLLIDGAGRIRYAAPGQFSFEDGKPVAGVVDGERVTPWSGVSVGSGSPSAAPPLGKLVAGVGGG